MTRRTTVRLMSTKKEPDSSAGTKSLRALLSSGDQDHSPFVFSPDDTTAGSETELQAAVGGSKADVVFAWRSTSRTIWPTSCAGRPRAIPRER